MGSAVVFGSGCSGSVRVKSSAEVDAKEPDPFAALNDPEPTPSLASAKTSGNTAVPTLALLGARHDLNLKPHNEPSCSCMAFAVGTPADPRFVWEGTPPSLSAPNGAVVAFSMVDGECETGLSASYRGYEAVGNNVHILLEPAVDGRPRLNGAVLPKPLAGGAYVVVPPADAPFGRSRTPGEAQCILAEGKVAAPTATKSTYAPAGSNDAGASQLNRRQVRATAPTEEVPTAEEFAESPSDIRDDNFDAEHSGRDGFHLGLLLGAEYPMLKVNIGNGIAPATLSGLGVGFDLTVGGNVLPDLAIGLMVGGATTPNPSLDVGGDISNLADTSEQAGWDVDGTSLVLNGTNANIFRIGAFLDYYFTSTTNWHGLLAVGYSSVTFTGGALNDSPSGFAANAGIGYDLWLSYHWSMGLIGRVQWSPLSSDELDNVVHLISPHFGLTGTFH